jgi:hypothetical protein
MKRTLAIIALLFASVASATGPTLPPLPWAGEPCTDCGGGCFLFWCDPPCPPPCPAFQ